MPERAIVGNSLVFCKALDEARKLAETTIPIHLFGESGTGKELLARLIHKESLASAGPFVPLNCGALSHDLIRSELFGHEKGAFTGATARRRGVFERANGGTVFLDEVGELPAEIQAQFLRVLEQKTVTLVGGEQELNLDFGLVSASNKDLKGAVENGSFRSDLFYRLGGAIVRVPSLRERPGDIPLLADHFYRELRGEPIKDGTWVSLRGYAWPGNVRELRTFIHNTICLLGECVVDEDSIARALKRHTADMPSISSTGRGGHTAPAATDRLRAHMTRLGIPEDVSGIAACGLGNYILDLDKEQRRRFLGERCSISEDAICVPLLADAVALACVELAESKSCSPLEIAAREFGLHRMRRKCISDLAVVERTVYARLKNA